MIISDDKQELAAQEAAQAARLRGFRQSEALPEYTQYTPSESGISTADTVSSQGTTSAAAPPNKPTNFLSLSRTNGSIKGTYLIDTDLAIPESILPPLARGERRQNLKLSCINGAIKVDIRISPSMSGSSQRRGQAALTLNSRNGSISAKFHAPTTKLSINVSSQNGSVHLYLPRSFTGPFTTTLRNGALASSSTLAREITVFAERDGRRHAFVGDVGRAGYDPSRWQGDELSVESTNGSVKVYFVDDVYDGPPVPPAQWENALGRFM